MPNFSLINSTYDASHDEISPVLIAVILATCLWIIVCNGAIVCCFITNRRLLSGCPFNVHVLSLAGTDLLVGICTITAVVIVVWRKNVSFPLCYIQFCLIFTSQLVGILHILGICVHRLLVVIKIQSLRNGNIAKLIACQIIFAWIFSIFICLIFPYLSCMGCQSRFTNVDCTVMNLFQERAKYIGSVWGLCFLVALLLTDIIYAFLCVRLLQIQNMILPTVHNSSTTQPPIGSNVNSQLTNFAPPLSQRSQTSSRAIQKKAFWTIGIVICALNLFLGPYVVGIIVESQAETGVIILTKEIRFLITYFIIMNSAVNPVIYVVRTKPLKETIRQSAFRVANSILSVNT